MVSSNIVYPSVSLDISYYAIAYYSEFYDINYLQILGRVTSGKGGDIVLAETNKVLAEEYPELSINVQMPDEKTRRVGQSAAAASLPMASPSAAYSSRFQVAP